MAHPTTNLSAFLPLVQPNAPGASIPIMTQALRLAAIEFCERTRCWRQIVTVTTDAEGRAAPIPPYAAIHAFEHAIFDDAIRLQPIAYTDLDLPTREAEARPAYITQTEPGEVRVVPAAAGELELSVFLKPRHGQSFTLDADDMPVNAYDTVPEFLLRLHGETIAAGALGRLLVQPRVEYYDPDRAMYYQSRFERSADAHSFSPIRGQQEAAVRITPHWF